MKKNNPLVDVHLLGAAYPANTNPEELTAAVKGKIYNYYSKNDQVLQKLFSAASFGKKAAGYTGFTGKNEKLINVDVTDLVSGHRKYIDFVQLGKQL